MVNKLRERFLDIICLRPIIAYISHKPFWLMPTGIVDILNVIEDNFSRVKRGVLHRDFYVTIFVVYYMRKLSGSERRIRNERHILVMLRRDSIWRSDISHAQTSSFISPKKIQ